jgi:hypothetical protein
MDPVHLVTHYSGAADSVQPRNVYFFLNLDEKDTEDGGGEEEEQFQVLRLSGKGNDRFFISLPNKLDTKMAIAAAIYWFRQLSKVGMDGGIWAWQPFENVSLVIRSTSSLSISSNSAGPVHSSIFWPILESPNSSPSVPTCSSPTIPFPSTSSALPSVPIPPLSGKSGAPLNSWNI